MKHLHLLVFLIFSILCSAQKVDKVTVDDIQQSYNSIDSTADAAYLHTSFDAKLLIYDSPVFVMKHHKRIKIYNKQGEAYGEFEIQLYKGKSENEKISKIKAFSYNLENGEIVKTKLEKSQIYEEDVSENIKLIKFAMPKVKPGTVVDVQYEIKSPFIYSIPIFYFQHYIPVHFAEMKITVPDFLSMAPVVKGNKYFQVEEEVTRLQNRQAYFVKYTLEDVEPIEEDEYVLSENDFRCGIKYEVHSVKWSSTDIDYYSEDWETIGNNLLEQGNFGGQLKKKLKNLDFDFTKLNTLSDLEKVKRIYSYVNNNFSWNKEIGDYPEEGLVDFIKNKSGNVADFNLLILNMLKKIGLESYPFVIKSRNYGILNEGYPSLTELNYLLALVVINDKIYFLDASSKDHPFGLLPLRAINISGLLVEKDKSRIVNMTNPNLYLSLRKCDYDLNIEEGCLEGEGEISNNKFASVKYRLKLKDEDDDTQDIEESDDDLDDEDEDDEDVEEIVLENEYEVLDIKNKEDISGNIKVKFSEKNYSAFKKIDNYIFLNSCLDFGITKNPFFNEKREHPVFYNNKIDLRRTFVVNLPENYSVDSIPLAQSISLPNGDANYTYEAVVKNNQLRISTIFKINKITFLPNEYADLKKFYDVVIAKQNEQIVLMKK